MADEHFRRVEAVFQAALECAPEARSGYLEEACRGDADLRREVEALLSAHQDADGFLSHPAGASVTDATLAREGLSAETAETRRIGPYRLMREIGRGGMGSVFLAVREDREFRQQVAAKLIKRGLDSDEIVSRFRRERQILASLNHPNIARLLDGGTTPDGTAYFVMEYIDGEPINRYCASRKLGPAEILALFRPVCQAVHHAHLNLVVHRDIKPQNILVTSDGTPKLLDFGIAKLLNPAMALDTAAPTAAAARVMTPFYASPEQVRGETVTHATDVYSLGVVLYELLTGVLPYAFPSNELNAVAKVVSESDPVPPSVAVRQQTGEAPRGLRGDLDTIVLKALAKEPAHRYGSAPELAEDIARHLEGRPVKARAPTIGYRLARVAGRHSRILSVAAGAALVASLGTVLVTAPWSVPPPSAESPAESQSLAVLPFREIGGQGGDNVVGVGMAEAIARRLGRTRGLLVRPIGSVLKIAAGQPDPIEAGRELRVDRVVDGTFARSGGQVSLTVQLVDVRAGAVLWSERFEEAEGHLLALPEVAAGRVARLLLPHVVSSPETDSRHLASTQVQDLYLKGRYYMNQFTAEDARQAVAYLSQAVALDSSFAPAWASLAAAYVTLPEFAERSPGDSFARARGAALRAIELDAEQAEAHVVLGWIHFIIDWKWNDAEPRFRRAIAIDPGSSYARRLYGACLTGLGRFAEALTQFREAHALDPLSRPIGSGRLRALFMATRFDEVVREAPAVLEADPDFGEPRVWVGLARIHLGDAQGLLDIERAVALAPLSPQPLASLGWAYGRLGRRRDAQSVLDKLHRGLSAAATSPYLFAEVEAGMGHGERAVSAVLEASRAREPLVRLRFAVDPRMGEVRKDPRMQPLLAELAAARPAAPGPNSSAR